MREVPLYDGDENVGSVPLITNLDTWNGMRWRYLRTGCHLGVSRLSGGRYYACYSSDWPEGIVRRKREDCNYEILFRCEDDFGPPYLAVVIPEEEARELVRNCKEEMPEEI